MSVINTNISAIAAQNSLRTSGLNQSTAMERLSTGIRINSAKDDAAGLAISTRMTANIRGIAAAIRNANDGISLTQTAEGSLATIGDNLQRIRELAVQSANSGNNASDRAALNAEATQLVAEIDRVANNTAFNGIKLLDGSYQNQSLQVGAGNEINDRISITIGSAKASALGIGTNLSYSKTLNPGSAVPTTSLSAGDLTINGYQVGATSSDGVSFTNSSGSGLAKASAINAISGQTGVTATVSSTDVTGVVATTFGTAIASGELNINGVNIGAIEASTSAVDRGTQVTSAINAKSAQTGVTATSNSSGVVSLKAIDGRNINITANNNALSGSGLGTTAANAVTKATTNTTEASVVTFTSALAAGNTVSVGGLTYTSTGATSIADLAKAFANLKNGSTGNSDGLLTGTYSGTFTGFRTGASSATGVTAISTTPANNVGDIPLAVSGGVATVPTAVTTNTTTSSAVTFSAGLGAGQSATFGGLTFTSNGQTSAEQLANAFSNLAAGTTAVQATAANSTAASLGSFTGTLTGFSTEASNGSTVSATSTSVTALAAANVIAVSMTGTSSNNTSTITLSTTRSDGITLGGSTGLASTGQTAGYSASIAGAGGVSAVNISTAAGAQSALTTLDAAINTITDSRAAMGAYQNRLTASIANLETTSMNLQASRSRILDTDYAKETTNLAKSQIVQQAATAMLAQANQSAQSVLALLK